MGKIFSYQAFRMQTELNTVHCLPLMIFIGHKMKLHILRFPFFNINDKNINLRLIFKT